MPENQTRQRWMPWILILAGIAMMAFPLGGGFRALQAIGVPVANNSATVGVIVLYLITGGLLAVIVGLILALRERPGWLVGAGSLLLLLGGGPLLTVIVRTKLGLSADPNPNPIGFGMLAAFTFVPALVLLVGGLVARATRKERRV
jgi:hypothetical protein